MNTNHTPGPWRVGMNPGPIVYGAQGEQVANLFVAMVEQDENKSNARLIASAPELLEVLEALIIAAKWYSSDPVVMESVDCARAIIAKAKGVKP